MERRKVNHPPIVVYGRGDQPFIIGYASLFYSGLPSSELKLFPGAVERMAKTAFDGSAAEVPFVVFDGATAEPAGVCKVTVDDVGLRYRLAVDKQNPIHQRLLTLSDRSELRQSAIAFERIDVRWESEGALDVRWLDKLKVLHVGIVLPDSLRQSTEKVAALAGELAKRVAELESIT